MMIARRLPTTSDYDDARVRGGGAAMTSGRDEFTLNQSSAIAWDM